MEGGQGMNTVAVAIIVAGFFIAWEIRDLTSVIKEIKSNVEELVNLFTAMVKNVMKEDEK